MGWVIKLSQILSDSMRIDSALNGVYPDSLPDTYLLNNYNRMDTARIGNTENTHKLATLRLPCTRSVSRAFD